MSKWKRLIMVASSGVLATVVAIGIQLASTGSATGSPTNTQTIDAKANPTAAGQALNACAVSSNCKFTQSGNIKVAYDAPRILGDALYNCGRAEAEDTVAISDERSSSTAVEESMSVKATVSFLELARASIEAEVKSKQLEEVATKTTHTNSVSVEPGEIGYTVTKVPTAALTGDTQVTSGVNLIDVTNVALNYPGYGDQAINKIDWTSFHNDMTSQERHDRCSVLPPLNPTTGTLGASRPASGPTVVICGRGRGCVNRRTVTGIGQPIRRGTRVSLARGRLIYATGTMGKARGVLRAQRRVRPGTYTLLLSGPRNASMLSVKVR